MFYGYQTAPSSCKYCPAWRGSQFNYRSVSVPLPKQAASSPADKVNEATFTPPAVTGIHSVTCVLGWWRTQRNDWKGNRLTQDQKPGSKTSIPEPYWRMELTLMKELLKGLVPGCSIWARIPALLPRSSCCIASLGHTCRENVGEREVMGHPMGHVSCLPRDQIRKPKPQTRTWTWP